MPQPLVDRLSNFRGSQFSKVLHPILPSSDWAFWLVLYYSQSIGACDISTRQTYHHLSNVHVGFIFCELSRVLYSRVFG